MNVSGIISSLWAPDFSINYHNFTSMYVGELVDADGERAIEYKFGVPYMPQRMELRLLAAIIYEDPKARTQHANVFFNETIVFSEPTNEFAIKEYLPYVLGTAATAFALYIIRDLFMPKQSIIDAKTFYGDAKDDVNIVAQRDASEKARNRNAKDAAKASR